MSNLSDLLPSGGGSKSAEFVASGTLPNGQAVILNANGTVTAVAETSTTTPESIPAGAASVFESSSTSELSMAFDPNSANKFVVAYRDDINSSYAAAIVGTVSGTSISFGTAVVFESVSSSWMLIAFDPNNANKFVVAYRATSGYGRAIVGTVSGTSLSFGTAVVFESSSTVYISMNFDPNNANKFVVAYRGTSNYGKAIVGTVSGTSISFGTAVVFESADTGYISMAFDASNANKFVVAYSDAGNSDYGTAVVGTVSGTSLSFGTAVVFENAQSIYISMDFDPNNANKFVVVYRDGGNANYGTAIIGTVSGTSISFGSAVLFSSADTGYMSMDFDPNNANKFVVAYQNTTNSSYGTAVVGTVSGTSLSFGSASVFESASTTFISTAFDPTNAGQFVVAYRGTSGYGTAIVGQIEVTVSTTNLTTTNFVGIPDKAYAASATATVVAKGGVSLNQTSLTIGTTYYVQGNGTLGTSAGTPSVEAGRAISATSILLKGK